MLFLTFPSWPALPLLLLWVCAQATYFKPADRHHTHGAWELSQRRDPVRREKERRASHNARMGWSWMDFNMLYLIHNHSLSNPPFCIRVDSKFDAHRENSMHLDRLLVLRCVAAHGPRCVAGVSSSINAMLKYAWICRSRNNGLFIKRTHGHDHGWDIQCKVIAYCAHALYTGSVDGSACSLNTNLRHYIRFATEWCDLLPGPFMVKPWTWIKPTLYVLLQVQWSCESRVCNWCKIPHSCFVKGNKYCVVQTLFLCIFGFRGKGELRFVYEHPMHRCWNANAISLLL